MTTETTKKTRRKRAKTAGNPNKLTVEKKDPNFRYYWFNDLGGRIQDALDRGYEFVRWEEIGQVGDYSLTNTQHDTEYVSLDAGQSPDGGRLRQFLMKQPIEFYKEDFQIKREHNMEIERQLGNIDEGQYDGGFSKKRE